MDSINEMNEFNIENKKEILERILDTKLTIWELNFIKQNYPVFYEKPNSNSEAVETVLNGIISNREQDFDFNKSNYIEDVFSDVNPGEIKINGGNYIYHKDNYYFEWDIIHSEKHGLTISKVADAMLNSDKYPILDTRNDYGERRYRILCKLDESNYISVFLYKYSPNCIRIITAIKISSERYNRYEKELYKK